MAGRGWGQRIWGLSAQRLWGWREGQVPCKCESPGARQKVGKGKGKPLVPLQLHSLGSPGGRAQVEASPSTG